MFSVLSSLAFVIFFFFFNDTATTEIYTLSLHDALPISRPNAPPNIAPRNTAGKKLPPGDPDPSVAAVAASRSEEHTSELQSHLNLVCRLLLEKKKKPIRQSCIIILQ